MSSSPPHLSPLPSPPPTSLPPFFPPFFSLTLLLSLQGSWHEEIQRHMSKLLTDKIPTDNDLIMQRERELK